MEAIIASPYYSSPTPEQPLGQFIAHKLAQHAEKTLFIDAPSGRSLTGHRLLTQAHKFAKYLVKTYGVVKGDLAMFNSGNLLEFAIAQVGIMFVGLPFSVVTLNCKAYEILRQVDDCKGNIMFTSWRNFATTDAVVKERPQSFKLVIILDLPAGIQCPKGYHSLRSILDLLELEPDEDIINTKIPFFDVKPKEDIYIIIYTSGSTGLPKGAAHTHYSILHNVISFTNCPHTGFIERDKGTIWAGHFAFVHSSGANYILHTMTCGFTMVVFEVADCEQICAAIERYKITAFGIFPSFGELIVNELADKYDLSSVRIITTCGSPFPSATAQRILKRLPHVKAFVEMLGSTEMSMIASRRRDEPYEQGNVGKPLPGIEIKIIDASTERVLKRNQSGEICIRGLNRFKEYINKPEATRESFTADGWLKSGDIGYLDDNGDLHIIDRIKAMIKYKGYSVYPAECEAVLAMHPAVKESIVVGVPHPIYNELPRAYVVLKPGAKATAEELEKFVADRLADQKRLRGGVVFIEAVPRMSIGKPDRTLMKKIAAQNPDIDDNHNQSGINKGGDELSTSERAVEGR